MAQSSSIRVDQLLLERELAESRQKAQALVLAGQVLIDEQKIDKPSRKVSPDAAVRLLGQPAKFVSRAGFKLEAALDAFRIDVNGRVCLDIGASTGGFTDCLLQRGAKKVYAIDVGSNQLHWKIRQDPRVVVRERVNARYLQETDVPEPCQFACCDVSFISATLILPAVAPRLEPGADIVVLAKPQFEAGREQVGAGGIVRDDAARWQAAEKVGRCLDELGFGGVERIECPLHGATGNRELLVHATLPTNA